MKFFLVFALIISSQSFADTKLSLSASLLYNTAEADYDEIDQVEENPKVGLGIGLRALMGITDQLFFRSGGGFIQRNIEISADDSDASGLSDDFDVSLLYLNIPLTLYWKASPQVGFLAERPSMQNSMTVAKMAGTSTVLTS